MVAYYQELEKTSDRIKVVEIGKSTEGRPLSGDVHLVAGEPRAKLDEYRQMNAKLADPRGVPQAELDRIVREGKAVVVQSYDLHSSEIGSSLTAVEFTYDLVTRTDPDDAEHPEQHHPIMHAVPESGRSRHGAAIWYMKYVGTPYEGGPLLGFTRSTSATITTATPSCMNMVRSCVTSRRSYSVDWNPQAYIDHHQMGQYGPRM